MPDYGFDVSLVTDQIGGVIRTARNARITVTDPVTLATAAGLKQSGQPVPWVTSDGKGRVNFTATIGAVVITSPNGLSRLMISPDYMAANMNASASAAASAASASNAADAAAASAALVGAPAGTAIDTYINGGTSAAIRKSDQPVNVKDYGAKADNVTNDTPAFNAAITAAQAAGRAVYIPAGTYRLRTQVNLTGTNVRISGAGIGKTILSIFGEASPINAVMGHTGNVDGLTISDLSFVGTTVDDVTAPRRARTYTSPGFNSALQVSGDLAPSETRVVRNVRVERVEVKGAAGLPMLFSGVRGESRLQDSRSELTMDWGWTWCERAVVIGNTSYKSADNGFSISRGTQSAVVSNNVAELCCFWGVWVAGFVVTGGPQDRGPQRFSVTGNTVTTAGYGGICADDAPKVGAISGNTVSDVRRGPTDIPTDIRGVGIIVGGFPSNVRNAPTSFATDITVSGNTLVDCARGGIEVTGASRVNVVGNTVIRPGSQFLADGSTSIASSDTSQNFGVAVLAAAASTVSDLVVHGNAVIDDRSTAFANYAWFTTGSSNPRVSGNIERGTRQSGVLTHDNIPVVVHSGTHTFSANTKYTAGATAGANAASGTVAGFDINGAAGSTRIHQFLTAGSRRWLMRASSDAESGSNAGTHFQIDAYDDAGVLIKSMLTMTRDGKMSFNGKPAIAPAALPAAATDAASTMALANAIRSALINLGLAT